MIYLTYTLDVGLSQTLLVLSELLRGLYCVIILPISLQHTHSLLPKRLPKSHYIKVPVYMYLLLRFIMTELAK